MLWTEKMTCTEKWKKTQGWEIASTFAGNIECKRDIPGSLTMCVFRGQLQTGQKLGNTLRDHIVRN